MVSNDCKAQIEGSSVEARRRLSTLKLMNDNLMALYSTIRNQYLMQHLRNLHNIPNADTLIIPTCV